MYKFEQIVWVKSHDCFFLELPAPPIMTGSIDLHSVNAGFIEKHTDQWLLVAPSFYGGKI